MRPCCYFSSIFSQVSKKVDAPRESRLYISVLEPIATMPSPYVGSRDEEGQGARLEVRRKRSKQLPTSWRGIPSLELESSLSIMILLCSTCPPERSKLRLVGLFLILSFHSLFRIGIKDQKKGKRKRQKGEMELSRDHPRLILTVSTLNHYP